MSTVAVVSADFGRYHEPSPFPAQSVDCEAVLVTDEQCEMAGWRNVVEPILDFEGSARAASKLVKCLPERYTDADIVVWIDAQLVVTSARFVAWCVDGLGDGQVAAIRHPAGRTSILAEAAAGQGPQGRGRFAGMDTVGQARHYIAGGHPDGWGLWWTMILVRRMTPEIKRLGNRWLAEQQRWSTHDQVSFPPVARDTVGAVVDLPVPRGDLCHMRPRRPRGVTDVRSA